MRVKTDGFALQGIDLATQQYADLLRVPFSQVATPLVYSPPPPLTPTSPFSLDQPQAAVQPPLQDPHSDLHCPQQQLPGHLPVQHQGLGMPAWQQGQQYTMTDHSPTSIQDEGMSFDAAASTAANSTPSAASDSHVNAQAMLSPHASPVTFATADVNTPPDPGGHLFQQLLQEQEEELLLPPDPMMPRTFQPGLPPTAPQPRNSFSFGQQVPEPVSSFGQSDVNRGSFQDSTPFCYSSSGSIPNGTATFAESSQMGSLSNGAAFQGHQWPGQGSREVPQGAGQPPQDIAASAHSQRPVPRGFGWAPPPQEGVGTFEGGAVPAVLPGRPVYGHSQSYSKVPSRRIVRGPSFQQRGVQNPILTFTTSCDLLECLSHSFMRADSFFDCLRSLRLLYQPAPSCVSAGSR